MSAGASPASGWMPALKCGAMVAVGWTLLYWRGGTVLELIPACVLHAVTGMRCPFCGMTRDFVAIAHWACPSQNPCSAFVALCTLFAPVLVFVRAAGVVSVPLHALRQTLIVFTMIAFVLNNVRGYW
jgi:hypothetical protein